MLLKLADKANVVILSFVSNLGPLNAFQGTANDFADVVA